MKETLDKIDMRILYELDKNARIPDTQLAKKINKSKETVRYRISQLKNKGIIKGFTVWVDPTKLGYSSAKIYLNLANIPEKKKEFIDYVSNDKNLFWLGMAEGAWNVGLTYFIKSNAEYYELKNKLISKFKDLILETQTGVLVDASFCPKSFLYQEDVNWVKIFSPIKDNEIDRTDKIIIRELFQNSRIKITEIARKHDLTIDIVKHRIKKLEKKEIIFKYLAKIDYNKLGYEFFKTFLYFKNLNQKDENKLKEYARQNPKILHLVRQISEWDIELEIMCENYLEYNEIISDLTEKFSNIINRVETAIMTEDLILPGKKLIFED